MRVPSPGSSDGSDDDGDSPGVRRLLLDYPGHPRLGLALPDVVAAVAAAGAKGAWGRGTGTGPRPPDLVLVLDATDPRSWTQGFEMLYEAFRSLGSSSSGPGPATAAAGAPAPARPRPRVFVACNKADRGHLAVRTKYRNFIRKSNIP